MTRINIMTSCDENYAKHVPVQLLSIADNLASPPLSYDIHFFLFYCRVKSETIRFLQDYSESLGLRFYAVYISDTAPYEELAVRGGVASLSGEWPYEAYFSIECHRYLPPDVERVLYIDAADILVLGDIADYYFESFEGCSLIATCSNFKVHTLGRLIKYEAADWGNDDCRLKILRGLFNSGSYVINVGKFRRENLSTSDYINLKNALVDIYPEREEIYFGDQGLLSAVFVGDIKYYGYPKERNLWYQPYSFCIWFFDRAAEVCGGNPWYIPRVPHFAGGCKPWNLTNENEAKLKPGQWPYYQIYRLYAARAPKVVSSNKSVGSIL